MSTGQVPYVIRGERNSLTSERRCDELAQALEAAWGVRILRLQSCMDCRDPNGPGGRFNNDLSVWLALSGTEEALLAAGLIQLDQLPANGRTTRQVEGISLRRNKQGLHLSCSFGYDHDTEAELRVRDAMAAALWRSLKPSR